jgi:hypothetical protein
VEVTLPTSTRLAFQTPRRRWRQYIDSAGNVLHFAVSLLASLADDDEWRTWRWRCGGGERTNHLAEVDPCGPGVEGSFDIWSRLVLPPGQASPRDARAKYRPSRFPRTVSADPRRLTARRGATNSVGGDTEGPSGGENANEPDDRAFPMTAGGSTSCFSGVLVIVRKQMEYQPRITSVVSGVTIG